MKVHLRVIGLHPLHSPPFVRVCFTPKHIFGLMGTCISHLITNLMLELRQTQYWFIDERNWMWLKETHVIVLVPHGNDILHNDIKGDVNCIMGSSEFIPWTQRKRWIPFGSMGCVHTHWRMIAIEGWGSPTPVRSVLQKNGENNWKVGKTSRVIN